MVSVARIRDTRRSRSVDLDGLQLKLSALASSNAGATDRNALRRLRRLVKYYLRQVDQLPPVGEPLQTILDRIKAEFEDVLEQVEAKLAGPVRKVRGA
jgi:hypothetical protein